MIDGSSRFETTCWSQVINLCEDGGDAYEAALENLARVYWRPVYAFIRRRGIAPAAAEDLTQAFFVQMIERRSFERLDRERGSFRGYLCQAVRNFIIGEHRHAHRKRRHPSKPIVPVHDLEDAIGGIDSDETPEAIYERQWARSVVREAIGRLEKESAARGRETAFRVFERWVLDRHDPGAPKNQEELAAEFGLSKAQVNNYIHRGKDAFRRLVRETVADYVSTEADLERELESLRDALSM